MLRAVLTRWAAMWPWCAGVGCTLWRRQGHLALLDVVREGNHAAVGQDLVGQAPGWIILIANRVTQWVGQAGDVTKGVVGQNRCALKERTAWSILTSSLGNPIDAVG